MQHLYKNLPPPKDINPGNVTALPAKMDNLQHYFLSIRIAMHTSVVQERVFSNLINGVA
jgi:hypothetical protein